MAPANTASIEELKRRHAAAELGGGADRIRKQHEAGKLTARERVELLVDAGSFVEIDALVTHRCTDFGMELVDAVIEPRRTRSKLTGVRHSWKSKRGGLNTCVRTCCSF